MKNHFDKMIVKINTLQQFLNNRFKYCQLDIKECNGYLKVKVIKKHDENEWYCVLTREEFNSSDIKWKVRLGKDIVSGVNFIASHRSHRLRKKHNFIIIVFSTRKSLLPAKDLEIMNELPSSYYNGQSISDVFDGYFFENKLVHTVFAYCSKDHDMVTLL